MDELLKDVESIADFHAEMVEGRPPTVIDQDAAVYPLAFVWDDTEDIDGRNRLEVGTISANIAIWCEGRDYHKEAENLRAKIKERLYSDGSSLRALKATCREVGSDKFYVILEDEADDTILGLGGLTMRLEIKYLTKYLDPFSQLNY
jgi:hypothetical protein